MNDVEPSDLNFLKLEGDRVKDGNVTIADARSMLDGVEKSTKYFINANHPALAKMDYDIEIRLESGSLIAWVVGIAGAGAMSYVVTYANQIAKNDAGDKTSKEVKKDIIDGAVRGMKTTAKIAKHVGAMGKRTFTPDEAKVKDVNTITLKNGSGQELMVSKAELDTYMKAPKDIFKKLASGVDDKTKLYIGEPGETIQSSTIVSIDSSTKSFFKPPEEKDDGIVFPGWQHGEYRTLKGELRRANTGTGTLGFFCDEHTITSYLHGMKIRDIKDSLFDKEVEIEAKVIRTQKKLDSEDDLKKPKLEIFKVTTLNELISDEQQAKLFELEREDRYPAIQAKVG